MRRTKEELQLELDAIKADYEREAISARNMIEVLTSKLVRLETKLDLIRQFLKEDING